MTGKNTRVASDKKCDVHVYSNFSFCANNKVGLKTTEHFLWLSYFCVAIGKPAIFCSILMGTLSLRMASVTKKVEV